jgi:hypothetical protein
MRSLTTYLLLMYGINMLLFIFGLNPSGTTSALFTLLFNPQNITSSSIYSAIALMLSAGSVIAGIVYGFFVKNFELSAFQVVASTLLLFVPDWISIYNILSQASHTLAILFISPMIVMYIFAVADYWRGRD